MIKLVTESFVFIDELKFYQALYADDASRFKPKEVFYNVPDQFLMDSQAKAKSASKSKSKSKKRPAPPKCFLFENSAFVSSVYDQFLKACHDDSRLDQNNKIAAADSDDFYGWSNNLAARSAVKGAPFFENVMKDSASLDTCQLDERSIEVVLDEPILYTNSVMKNLMLKNKDSSRKYIIPANSTFLTGDISMIRHFLHREMKYDLIIADPPWLNKSVKRKKSYLCVDTDDVLSSLPIPSMLDKGGLVCIWLSNKASVHQKTEEILKSWGLVKIALWHWLKVCTTNKPIVEFGRPEHKVPFESMLFACLPENLPTFSSKIRSNFCVISVPNANPSRKPPVAETLSKLNIFHSLNALELFARYLLPCTTSIGFETLKFQDEYFYEFGSE